MESVGYSQLNGQNIHKAHPHTRKWDLRFLNWINSMDGPRGWSKDPSRKVCAVIVKPNRRIVSLGYNGFATGVDDNEERYVDKAIKYEMVVHAEENALLTAERDVTGCIMYTTLLPCSRCAAKIINSGITKVVALNDDTSGQQWDNSRVNFDLTTTQFRESGVKLVVYNTSELKELFA